MAIPRYLLLLAVPLAAACEQPFRPPPGSPPQTRVVTVTLLPRSATIDTGQTQIFTATPRDSAGAPLSDRPVTWFSSDSFAARVSPSGVTIGLRPGITIITATSEGITTGSTLFITFPILAVSIEPSTAEIVPGGVTQLSASIIDASGDTLPHRPTWSSTDPSLATVDSNGLVRALAPGAVTITATSRGVRGSATITIVQVHFVSLSAGDWHTCGVAVGGAGWCWGLNDNYQLGRWDVLKSLTPIPINGAVTLQTMAAGPRHSCGIAPGGEAYCWGDGGLGQLGNDTDSRDPAVVSGGHSFAALTAGGVHTCGRALTDAGYCWGFGRWGELGTGDTTRQAAPAPITGGLAFAELSAGTSHTCGVMTGGAAYCWGLAESGALGDGTLPSMTCIGRPCSPAPIAVSGDFQFRSIGAGEGFTCGVTVAGAGYCWGKGSQGQLGDGTMADHATPSPVAAGLVYTTIAVGRAHACGLTTGGSVFCWGNGVASPSPVPGGIVFATITVGVLHVCGLSTTGIAYCWGANFYGQLGDGSTLESAAPVRVLGQP